MAGCTGRVVCCSRRRLAGLPKTSRGPAAGQAHGLQTSRGTVRAAQVLLASGAPPGIAATAVASGTGHAAGAVGGAGATGVELAAELHRTTREVVAYGLDGVDPAKDLRVSVIEAADRVLPALPPRPSRATEALLTARPRCSRPWT